MTKGERNKREMGRREGWEQQVEERWAAAGVIITKGPSGGLRNIIPKWYYMINSAESH